MTMLIKSKDLNGKTYTYTELGEETIKELETYGVLTRFNMKNSLLYHLDLNSGNQYSTKIPRAKISIAKGRVTYGGKEDLWECGVIRRGVRGIMGYLKEEDIVKYLLLILRLTRSQDWYNELPVEFYRHKTKEYSQLRQKEFLHGRPKITFL